MIDSIETLSTGFSDECGCPEHEISMAHITATVHLEPGGSADAFVDFGDWQEEWHFDDCADIEIAKKKTLDKFNSIGGILRFWSDH